MKSRQQGVTVVGMIFIAAGIVFVVIMALKLVPAYIEYATIQNHLRELARAPDTRNASPREIMAAFNRRAQIDGIASVNGRDLDISREGGEVILSAYYETRIKMVGNISACIEFEPSSD
ncbi:MAG: DUF4845 domain-containing protein [Betaproteobacteria bacterium]|nr:MAG: DUF4845 domain-containing protein [Betaproteobacteria bacterium]